MFFADLLGLKQVVFILTNIKVSCRQIVRSGTILCMNIINISVSRYVTVSYRDVVQA